LSLPGYDADSLMVEAAIVEGGQLEPGIDRLFSNARVQYAHIHYATPGCYACRVDRA